MKRAIANIVGMTTLCVGLILAVATVLLLFSGKMSVAGIFVIPAFALFIAGSNLREYAKKPGNQKTA